MRTVDWVDGRVRLIDQRALPWNFATVDYDDYRLLAQAVTEMVVRGAPAIGAAGAYGMALAARQAVGETARAMLPFIQQAAQTLIDARPTAVNLRWGVQAVLNTALTNADAPVAEFQQRLLNHAQQIADDDVRINQTMGAHGQTLIQDGITVLHHCNTGALAAVDWGTALGVVRSAHEAGKTFHVLLDETRPRLQGARLSAWELEQWGVSYDILPDTAAGHYMARGEINIVLVGADRVAANGDFANKIGTYQIAIMANYHGIPFYCVAPTSTYDAHAASGQDIPIEQRDPAEVTTPYGLELVPAHFKARNPAFDVTPHTLVTGYVTELGILTPPFTFLNS
jgi:methylthioribose-1-phosphate isomerase